jgi:drug/metabolite transporter (DMT)-like permease
MATPIYRFVTIVGTFFFLASKATSFSYATSGSPSRNIMLRNQRTGHRNLNTEKALEAAAQKSSLTTLAVVSKGEVEESEKQHIETDESTVLINGRTTLCLVALIYGTLNVSLRLIYQLPEPPTASALSTARGVLACVGFLPLFFFGKQQQATGDNTNFTIDEKNRGMASFICAGLELAFYNFLAQGLLNIGLLSTSSARASFLTQTSVVFTPVLSRIFGQRVPSNVWIACGLALVGLTVLSSAAVVTSATAEGTLLSSFINFTTGDCLVLCGAASWSMYLYRLSKIGPKFDEVNLQFTKSILLAIFYAGWLVTVIVRNNGGAVVDSISAFVYQPFGWLMNGVAFWTVLYSAVGPGTVADVLQQQGQKGVSASEANVILSLEPVFTALCAWLIMGESTSIQEALGGAIILAAASVATR